MNQPTCLLWWTNQRVYCDEPINVFIDVLRLFETVGYVSLEQICRTNMTVHALLQVPNIDNPLHSNTFSRFRTNQSLLFLLNVFVISGERANTNLIVHIITNGLSNRVIWQFEQKINIVNMHCDSKLYNILCIISKPGCIWSWYQSTELLTHKISLLTMRVNYISKNSSSICLFCIFFWRTHRDNWNLRSIRINN